MQTAEQRYFNDIEFKRLVDSMYDAIVRAQFTPSELREAAVYAAIRYEMSRPVPQHNWQVFKVE